MNFKNLHKIYLEVFSAYFCLFNCFCFLCTPIEEHGEKVLKSIHVTFYMGTAEGFQVLRGLLGSGRREETDSSAAHCDHFANHFADKTSCIHSNLYFTLAAKGLDGARKPDCPVYKQLNSCTEKVGYKLKSKK